jgi:hypothetical protein
LGAVAAVPSRESLDGFDSRENLNGNSNARRLERLIVVLSAAVVLGIGLFALNPFPVGVLHDDAVYVILAKSLATGQGFRYLNLPGEPFATHFPPGYPVFLAALWRFMPDFPGNVVLFKAANAALLALGFLALRALLRAEARFGRWGSIIVAFAGVVGVPMLFVSTLVLSETLFFALAAACLLGMDRVIEEQGHWGKAAALGFLCAIASLVRTPGVALIGAAVVCLVLRRRWRDATIVGGVSALTLAPWMLWAGRHGRGVPDLLLGAYGSYTAWFGDALRTRGAGFAFDVVAANSRSALDVLGVTVTAFGVRPLNLLAFACVLLLIVIGVCVGWRRARALAAFAVIYAVLVLTWPSHPARYVWGVWPLVFAFPALAIRALASFRGADVRFRSARVALLGVAILPAIGHARYNMIGYEQRMWLAIPQQGAAMLRPVVNGIRQQVAPGAVVAAPAEAAVYLYTGHQTVPTYTFTADAMFQAPDSAAQANALGSILRIYPVDAIVGSTSAQQIAIARLAPAFNGLITAVDSFPGGVIYRCGACGTVAAPGHAR